MASSDHYFAEQAFAKIKTKIELIKSEGPAFGKTRDIEYLFGPHAPAPGSHGMGPSKASRAVATELYEILAPKPPIELPEGVKLEDLPPIKPVSAERQEAVKDILAYLNDYFGLGKQAAVHGPG
jgi:hypothetical protein